MMAFVTGATGFVGSHIAGRLLDEGWRVAALVRSPDRPSWLDRLPGVEKVPGDLADGQVLARAVRDADVVFHAAGLVKARNEAEYFQTNVEGTRAVLDAALAAGAGLKRFVQISSQAAHGPSQDGNFSTEDSEPRPITPYGRSKLAGERLALERAGELPVTVIRPPAVYGPREKDILIYFKLASWGLVPIPGDPKRRLSLVFAKDLARAVVDAALSSRTAAPDSRSTPPGNRSAAGTYFITSGAHDWNELASAVARAVGRGKRIVLPGGLLRIAAGIAEAAGRATRRAVTLNRHKAKELLQDAWLCSHARAAKHFGYAPEWDLERGMAETAAWYRKEGWLR